MADPLPSARLGALARRLVRAVTNRARTDLAAAGYADLRPVHNVVFAHLATGGTRTTDMAARSGLTKQAVTIMIDYLEAAGYLRRVPDSTDRRAKLVELTERGRAAASASLTIADEIERTWALRLGDARLRELKATLADLVDSLEAAPPRPPSAATRAELERDETENA